MYNERSNSSLGWFGASGPGAAAPARPPVAKLALAVIGLSTMVLSILANSPLLLLAIGGTLALLVGLLWRGDDFPILLMAVAFQWCQVAVKPIESVVTGASLNSFSEFGSNLENAAWFGLGGIASLGLGLYLGAGRGRSNSVEATKAEARRWPQKPVVIFALGSIFLGALLAKGAGLAGPLKQPMLAMSSVNFVGLFVLTFWSFANRGGYKYLVPILGLEVVTGFMGFFADFRGPLLAAFVAVVSARPSAQFRSVAIAALLAALAISLAAFWSEIKADYRTFVSEGENQQVVLVSLEDRILYILDAAEEFDSDKFNDGMKLLLARVSYIDYLAATLDHVPSTVPHENGARLGQSILSIVMPRFLFPDKPPTPDDTEVTAYYTGLRIRAYQSTSISIGYLGELYIDFGYFGALVATLGLGYIAGRGHRILRDYDGGSRLVNCGLCILPPMIYIDFGTALIKLLGGSVLAFCAALVLQRFVVPFALARLNRRRVRSYAASRHAL